MILEYFKNLCNNTKLTTNYAKKIAEVTGEPWKTVYNRLRTRSTKELTSIVLLERDLTTLGLTIKIVKKDD